MTVRWESLSKKIKKIYPKKKLHQPIRIIIDQHNKVKPYHKVIKNEGKIWLIRLYSDNLKWPSKVKQIYMPIKKNFKKIKINLIKLMLKLGNYNINNLWIEAGSNFIGLLINLGLADELILYQAYKLLGSDARPLCLIQQLKTIKQALKFKLINFKKINNNIRLRLRPIKSNFSK